jgi:hypothetical protein
MTTATSSAGDTAVHLAHLSGTTALHSGSVPPAPPAATAASAPAQPRAEDDDEDEDAKRAKAQRRRTKARKRDEDDDGDDDPDEDEDEDEEEDMKASSVTGRARMRERRRLSAIFAAGADLNVTGARELAQHFAFETSMPRKQAIAALKSAAAALPKPGATQARRGLTERMQEAAVPNVPGNDGAGAGAPQSLAERVTRAMDFARGVAPSGARGNAA